MKKNLIFTLFILAVNLANAQGRLKTENVFLISLDGLRWQELFTGVDSILMMTKEYTPAQDEIKKGFWDEDPLVRRKKLMPFFWSTIANEGKIIGNRQYGNNANLTNTFWFSYPGYNELLTGFADPKVNSNDKKNNQNVTVLEYVNQQKEFKGKVAAFGSWDVFPYIINEERSGVPVNAGFESARGNDLTEREKFLNELQEQIPSPWGGVRLDAFTHHYALEHLKKENPKLVYIAYGETDDFAHDGRYDFYVKSANQTDAFIKELWDYVQSHKQYKDKTTFIIATDHGRGTVPLETWKHHGSTIEGADEVWFAVIGPDTKAAGELKTKGIYYQNQIAKTVARLLGLDFEPEKKAGAAMTSLYE
jgi:predicted AlkP superfamily pyrophosphatase or phosphodiesterase